MTLEKNVADGIHRVEDALVNWYIVEDGGALTVVDTGHPRSWSSLHSALRTLRRAPTDIEAIVLTHGHFDHMGFARRARQDLGVRLLAPVGELALVARPWDYEHERSRIRNTLEHPGFAAVFARMGLAGALWVRGTDQAEPYEPHGQLDVPGRPHVVFTPGHTHGHCALHLPDRGAVIAGDALVTFNPYTTGCGPQIVSGAATADSRQALASLEALRATGAERMLTGHGPIWTSGAGAAVDRALEAGPS